MGKKHKDEYPERPECDFDTRPLDQRFREADPTIDEAEQLDLFPDAMEEKEKKIVRRIKKILDGW